MKRVDRALRPASLATNAQRCTECYGNGTVIVVDGISSTMTRVPCPRCGGAKRRGVIATKG